MNQQPPLFVRSNNWLQPIPLNNVLFIQSAGNYCEIQTPERRHIAKKSLVTVLEILPPDIFVQVHRSYVVRLHAITRINTTANEIEIGEVTIPIGRVFRDTFMERIHVI